MNVTPSQVAGMQALFDEYFLLSADLTEQHGAWFLRNDDAPTRYDGNHVRSIRGDADLDALFAALDVHYADRPYRAVRVNPYTPFAVEARLLLEDYTASAAIVMASDRLPAGNRAAIDILAVPHDSRALDYLAGVQHGPGADEIRALQRRRGDAFEWYVAFDAGQPVGHLSQRTRQSLGYLESLFVDPHYRLRGIATALVYHATAQAWAAGAGLVFLPADADDTPKHMYRRMGFEPVYTYRDYRKELP